uniref:Uncharacterized protein n=1 Tax=Paraburkholderia sprentiae WSM5005 TaxID=754502 RepID=A0A1I9YNH7_9BURK
MLRFVCTSLEFRSAVAPIETCIASGSADLPANMDSRAVAGLAHSGSHRRASAKWRETESEHPLTSLKL